MLKYLMEETNETRTENGAVTLASTGSDCLDLFATIGALRHASEEEIVNRFIRAYMEDADMAMKILFFARDIRGGLGERRVFRIILQWLANNQAQSVKKNLPYIAEYGRYDDLLELLGTPCEKETLALLKDKFASDCQADTPSLLGKWLPSVNASNVATIAKAKCVAKAFGMNAAEYRKSLSALRGRIKIIENHLRVKDYTFDYTKQPSRAMFKYRQAFIRNDGERYGEYMKAVANGEAELHAGNLYPYELVQRCMAESGYSNALRAMTDEEKLAINATWAAMPDYGAEGNTLAVIDTSGSMFWQECPSPASVALSLGLYFAERNKGTFANSFMEFSSKPRLIKLKGKSFLDKLAYALSFCEVADTNLEKVFKVILTAAVKNKLPQEELPQRIVLISDMEFNQCVKKAELSNFDNAKEMFAEHGYKLPQVIFWNVASRNRQQPVKANEQGVALVSGATPKLFEMVAGGVVDPMAFMLEVLNTERYAKIAA